MRVLTIGVVGLLAAMGGVAGISPSGGAWGGQPQEKAAGLRCGDAAPPLKVSEWVKGDAVGAGGGGFEKGRVYVVEFWATWCGPCIAAMPHLSELAQKHAKDVTVIGLTTLDPNQDAAKVRTFVTSKPDRMRYAVAIDESSETFTAYMRAAGRNGIPCSFVIDREGRVAFIGMPDQLDAVVDAVVARTWDIARDAKRESDVELEFNRLQMMVINAPADAVAGIEAFRTAHAGEPGMRKLVERLELPGYEAMVRSGNGRAAAVGRDLLYRTRQRGDADTMYRLARASITGVGSTTEPPPEVIEIGFDAVRDVLYLSERPEAEQWLRDERGPLYGTLGQAYLAMKMPEREIEARRRALECSRQADKPDYYTSLANARERFAQSTAAKKLNDELAEEVWSRYREMLEAVAKPLTAEEAGAMRSAIRTLRSVHPSFASRLDKLRLRLEIATKDPAAAATLRELARDADEDRTMEILLVCVRSRELPEIPGLAAACVDITRPLVAKNDAQAAKTQRACFPHVMLSISLRADGNAEEADAEKAKAIELAPPEMKKMMEKFIEDLTAGK